MDKSFGEDVRTRREALDIPQTALAAALGISAAVLSQQETGKRGMSHADYHRARAAIHELYIAQQAPAGGADHE